MHQYGMETPNIPYQKKKKSISANCRKGDTLFWDSQGAILQHYHEQDETINSSHHSELLRDKLKPAIWSKCQGQLS
jgi:hypothetical protein